MNTFEELKNFILSHLDDPDSLSRAIIELGALLYKTNKETSEANLKEDMAKISLMDNTPTDVRKMSATEADARATVITNGLYKEKMLEADATKEFINAIKVRINVLSWERKNA